jgi:hypothetical protein
MPTRTLNHAQHHVLSAEFDNDPGARHIIWGFFGAIAFLMLLAFGVGAYVMASSDRPAAGERSFSELVGELAATPAVIAPGIIVLDSDGQPIGPVVKVKMLRNKPSTVRFRIDPPLPGGPAIQEVQFPYASFTPLKTREGGLQLRLSQKGTVALASSILK